MGTGEGGALTAECGAVATEGGAAEETPGNSICGAPLHPRIWKQGQGQRHAASQSAASDADPSQPSVAATDTAQGIDEVSASTQCGAARDHTSATSTMTAQSLALRNGAISPTTGSLGSAPWVGVVPDCTNGHSPGQIRNISYCSDVWGVCKYQREGNELLAPKAIPHPEELPPGATVRTPLETLAEQRS